MLIKKDSILLIREFLKISQTLGMDYVIIRPDNVSGIDDKSNICIPNDIVMGLDYPLAISTIKMLLERIDLALSDSKEKFAVDAFLSKDDPQFIKELTFETDNLSLSYAPSEPVKENGREKAPRRLNDSVKWSFVCKINISEYLSKILNTAKAERVNIICNDGVVRLEVQDVNSKKLSVTLAKNVKDNEENLENFSFSYSSDSLLKVIKSSDNTIQITSKGFLKTKVSLFDVYVIPKV